MWPSLIQMIIIIQKRWTIKSSYYAYLIHLLSLLLLAKIMKNTPLKLLNNLKIKNNLHLLIQHQLLLLVIKLPLQNRWYTTIITTCTIIILLTLVIITILAFKALNLIAIKVGVRSLINLLIKKIITLTASNRKELLHQSSLKE